MQFMVLLYFLNLKIMKRTLLLLSIIFCNSIVFGQVEQDTIANYYFSQAKNFEAYEKYDSAMLFYSKASESFLEKDNIRMHAVAEIRYALSVTNLGMFDKATPLFDSLLNYTENNFGKQDSITSLVIHSKGILYFYQGQLDEALKLTEQALEIRKKTLPKGHPDILRSHNNISLLLFYAGKYEECAKRDTEVLNELIELFGEDHPEVANFYSAIGDAKNRIGNYKEALQLYNKALSIYTKLYGEDDLYVASTYFNIGMVLVELGDYERSIDYQTKFAEKTKELYGENSRNLASAYNNIGVTYWDWGEYDTGLDYIQKSFDIKKNLYSNNNPEMAEAYLNFGIIYDEKGDFNKALYYYNKAKEVYDAIYEPDNLNFGMLYNNFGVCYQYKGEYELSLEYFMRALNIKIKNLDDQHIDIQKSLNNIATVYFEREEYQKSIEYLTKNLNHFIQYYGDNHYVIADSYFNMASSYDKLGMNEKAKNLLDSCLMIRKAIYGNKHLDVATTMLYLANIHHKMGNNEKAEEYFKEAITLAESIYKGRNPKLSLIYEYYSGFLHDLDRNDEALNSLQNCFVNNTKSYVAKNEYSIPLGSEISQTQMMLSSMTLRNDILLAAYHSNNDEKLLESMLHGYFYCDTIINRARQNRITQSDKINLAKFSVEIYEGAISTCYNLYEKTKNISYLENAFYFIEKNKAGVLLEALASSEAQQFSGIPDSLLEKEKKLKSDIAFLNKKLAEQPDSVLELKIHDKLFDLNRNYEKLILTFENEFPSYHELKYSKLDLSIKQIQNQLDENTSIFSYFVGENKIYISIINKKQFMLFEKQKSEDFEAFIAMFRNEILHVKKDEPLFLSKLANRFYKMLIPIELNQDCYKNIIVIPDGELSLIPFEVLVDKYEKDVDYKSIPYLVKNHNISYSYSANLLFRTNPKSLDTNVEVSQLEKWLALAPVFSDEKTNTPSERSRGVIEELDNIGITRDENYPQIIRDAQISPLPGTEQEVENISNFIKEKNIEVSSNLHESAKEDLLKSEDIKGYNYLHIATHGFVNSEKPELSGILLAQNQQSKEDGILFTGEIYNLNLNADLTVLSACETGLGKISKGEGIIGLSRALLYAGSKNIIVSLWKVADNSTSNLMTDFYKFLLEQEKNKRSFSYAISEAKRKMIETNEYAHPYYWSPFILIGQ